VGLRMSGRGHLDRRGIRVEDGRVLEGGVGEQGQVEVELEVEVEVEVGDRLKVVWSNSIRCLSISTRREFSRWTRNRFGLD
jgi:hypothetical protein